MANSWCTGERLMQRTHSCGELTEKHAGKEVVLSGWVSNRRDHGGLTFVDLRDRYGITQVIFNPKTSRSVQEKAKELRDEFVVAVSGNVVKRPKGTENKELSTGAIEVQAKELEIVSRCEPLPLEVSGKTLANEDVRLKYRFLDLRRPEMQQNIVLRHRLGKVVREYFYSRGFLEIETPFLSKSTPEGARDYLVPSRVHPGKFFALPQSPQLFKQLLMVSGFDKYFQIVKCFRDEDLRADRQPEFTQIDVEMSFVSEENIFEIVEGLFKDIFKEIKGIHLKVPFPRISYEESMERFGVDNPDMRFGLELVEVTEAIKGSGFKAFSQEIEYNGIVKALNAEKCGGFSKKELDELIELAQVHRAKGLVWFKVASGGLEGPVAKFFNEKILKELASKTKAKENDLLLLVAGKEEVVNAALGRIRRELGKKLGLIDDKKISFVWIVDFPLLEFDEEEDRWQAKHHPFTSPQEKDLPLLEKEPGKVKARAYDVVLNGVELGGGSIRIHRGEVQEKMFAALGISKQEAEAKFGFLLDAFKYGAPPHGGIAFGFDRIAAMLAGTESIREVIAFPKNKAAVSLMDSAPSPVSERQLKELKLKLDLEKKGKK